MHAFRVPDKLIKPFNSDTVKIITNFAKLSCVEQNMVLGRINLTEGCKYDPQSVDINYRHVMQRLYGLIRQEQTTFEEKIDPRDFYRVFVVEPQQSFARIRAQSGAFLISAFHERFERSEVLDVNPGTPIYDHFMFDVPGKNKKQILHELNLLNITRESLFPSLDETAKSVIRDHTPDEQ